MTSCTTPQTNQRITFTQKEKLMKKETLVLAYSGGLDTSYSLKKLSQDGYEIHAVSVNTGGFSKDEITS
jgi:argininosuccinate synthase